MHNLSRTNQRAQMVRVQEFARFGVVGLSGVVVNSLILWALVQHVGLGVAVASALATEVAIITNFLLNDHWTFGPGQRAHSFAQRLLRYNGVCLGGLVITAVVLLALTTLLALPLLLANFVAVLCAMAWNYSLNSRWTWRSSTHQEPASSAMALAPAATNRLEPEVRLMPQLEPLHERAVGEPRFAFHSSSPQASAARSTLVLEAPLPVATHAGHATQQLELPQPVWRRIEPEAALAALVVAIGIGWVALGLPGAWAVVASLLLSLVFVVKPGVSARQVATGVLVAAVGVSSIDYLSWRMGVINWWNWWVSLPLFAAELFGALHTLGLQYTVWPRPEPQLRNDEDPTRRPIFIFIPTVSEGPSVLEPTLRGALAARARYLQAYPHGRVTIVVCNDGYVAKAADWQQADELAMQLGVVCITRKLGGGAKAGNIEHARQRIRATGDALLVIFDADQIATPEFLLRMVPPMADKRVGWVQSGQYYSNLDNPVARWANDQQALFYKLLCPGKSAQNAAFICGTNVLLRAAALDEIGGLPQDSVTEDFAASIDLHPRWQSIFIGDELAYGLGPLTLQSYFKQQGRWAIGTLGVLRTHWRKIFLPGRGGLGFAQRIQYALACTHYLSGVRDLIYLVAPLIFLILGAAAVRGAFLETFLWHFVPYWLVSQVAFWQLGWGKTSARGIVLGFGSFPVLLESLLTVVVGRRVAFAVTSKQREAGKTPSLLRPHLLAMFACVAALVVAALSGRGGGPVLVSAFWVLYTMAMLGGVLWLGWRDQAIGTSPARPRPRRLLRLARRLQPALAGATAVAAVGALAAFGPFTRPSSPLAPFVPAQETGRAQLGVALPFDLLDSRTPVLEHELGRSFGIVGRTQDISDSFDSDWAAELYQRGGQPWLTLIFAVPERPVYESSLPAIANGVHDEALRRWARDLRSYGQPVYLSVLPHVDRNWVPSSAVANGGIPQDVPRAWAHIRQLLREEGASNVALVWSPADPSTDQDYAPPADAIDAVLLSLISYPDQQWADPAAAIAVTQTRYPNTPLLLEVSAAGDPARKAAWLRSVGEAVGNADLHALIYHDGAPNPDATDAEHARWSLASDPQSLAAMRAAVVAAELQAAVPAGK